MSSNSSSSINNNGTLYPSEELKPLIEPTTPSITKFQPTLFSFKDGFNYYEVVSVESMWITKHGLRLTPRPEIPEYNYYVINKEYKDCNKNTIVMMTEDEKKNEPRIYKAQRSLAFMAFTRLDTVNSRLNCMQYMFLLWTITSIASIAGVVILMHHEGLF